MTWANLVHFQLVWWAMVLVGDALSVAVAFLSLAIFLWIAAEGWLEALILVGLSLLGFIADAVLAWAGLVTFREGGLLPPLWLAVVWLSFVLSLRYSLAWCGRLSIPVQALVGAVAGPASYFGAMAFGAVQFVHPWSALAAMAVLWALLFPSFLHWRMARHETSVALVDTRG